jgi:uncharacterized protein YlxW (UPF0749 family)
MAKKEDNYIFLFVFMLLGLLLTVQFRSVLHSNKGKPTVAYEIESYKEQLNVEKVKASKLREEIDKNLKLIEDFERSFFERSNDKAFESEWEKANIVAGLTNVVGNGVIIKLNDAPHRISKDVEDDILHNIDIVKVLNELKKAGAQALSVNNERIISTTGVICTGPTIRVNGTRYSVPFEVKALGPPGKMYSSLNTSEIIIDLKGRGLRIEIKEAKDIVIPAYSGNIENLTNSLEVVD